MIVTCPSCGRTALVSRAVLGKALTCPECATAFTVGTRQVSEKAATYRLRVAIGQVLVIVLGMSVCGAMLLFPPCRAEKQSIGFIGQPAEPIETELRWGYEGPHLGGHHPHDSGFPACNGIAYDVLGLQWLLIAIIVSLVVLAQERNKRRRAAGVDHIGPVHG